MSAEDFTAARDSYWSALASLFASSSTLVCCTIPALLVALGAGAALSSLVAVFPQIVWLSEYKEALFAFAGAMLIFSGVTQWRNRTAACPIDPALRATCLRTRKISRVVYVVSIAIYVLGGLFAFVPIWLAIGRP